MFRALVNGMYKEGYIDDAERDRANARLNNFNNAELIDIDAQINRTQADRVSSARELPSLPDINVSSPQSFSGFGGTSGQGSRLALAGNDPLLQGIASRSLAKGGILDAKKTSHKDQLAHQRISDHEKLCQIMQRETNKKINDLHTDIHRIEKILITSTGFFNYLNGGFNYCNDN